MVWTVFEDKMKAINMRPAKSAKLKGTGCGRPLRRDPALTGKVSFLASLLHPCRQDNFEDPCTGEFRVEVGEPANQSRLKPLTRKRLLR